MSPAEASGDCGKAEHVAQHETAKTVRKHLDHPRVRCRYEYEDRHTRDILCRFDAEEFEQANNVVDETAKPIFDFITKYNIVRDPESKLKSPTDNNSSKSKNIPAVPYSLPEYRIDIHSPSILNAVRSVVKYYPGQDLTGDPVKVKWPYAILAHHYDELSEFRAGCAEMEATALCVRERDANEHVGVLLEFLDKEVMEQVNAEKERNKKGFTMFEWQCKWIQLYLREYSLDKC